MDKEDDDIEASLAENVAMVERYYGVYVDKEYPLMKFINQSEHLQKFLKLETDMMTAAVNNAIAKAFGK
jgi:hypothetical protein